MNERKFNLAVCQLRTELEKQATMDKMERMVREAAEGGANVVVLPEMFNCPYTRKYFIPFAETADGESVRRMAYVARENSVILVGGSIAEQEGDKLYNTCFVFNEDGEIIARHRKAHMFDVDIPGKLTFKESDFFTRGDEVCVFDTQYGRMGVCICFDTRFPELQRAMARRGAEIILVPGQFNMTTGPSHWELTMRARAMDNEVWVVGAAAARYEGFAYECWGHSTVINPFGMVETDCDEKEQILYCPIDLAEVDRVRRELPTFLTLRDDIYTVTN